MINHEYGNEADSTGRYDISGGTDEAGRSVADEQSRYGFAGTDMSGDRTPFGQMDHEGSPEILW